LALNCEGALAEALDGGEDVPPFGRCLRHPGAVAKLVGIEGGVVSGCFNRNEYRVDGQQLE
jgi:hypothetical protein